MLYFNKFSIYFLLDIHFHSIFNRVDIIIIFLWVYSLIFQNIDNSTAIPMTKEITNDTKRNSEITYGIDDIPPWYLCLFMALQVSYIKYVYFTLCFCTYFSCCTYFSPKMNDLRYTILSTSCEWKRSKCSKKKRTEIIVLSMKQSYISWFHTSKLALLLRDVYFTS